MYRASNYVYRVRGSVWTRSLRLERDPFEKRNTIHVRTRFLSLEEIESFEHKDPRVMGHSGDIL